MDYDVAIIGAGISGIHTALACGRNGLKTLLIEKNSNPGGLTTVGLVNPFMKYDFNGKNLVGYIFEDFLNKLESSCGLKKNFFDSEKSKIIFSKMLKNSKVDVLYNSFIFDSKVINNKIEKISLINTNGIKNDVKAKYYVDCTGDGTLGYLSNAGFVSGNSKGENQAMTVMFSIGGVDFEKVRNDVSLNQNNFFGWVNPNFDLACVGGYFKEIEFAKKENLNFPHKHFFYTQIPNTNSVSVNSMDLMNNSIDPFKKSEAISIGLDNVEKIVIFAQKYVKGFENCYLEKISSELGIRESRRIIGKYTFTKNDVINHTKFEDGIVKCVYGIDIHNDKNKKYSNKEKNFDPNYYDYYEIPLRSLISKNISNLAMAGKCFSADYEGHSAARIQPTCAGMGQALGSAIYLATKNHCNLDYISKKEILKNLNQIS